MLKVLPLTTEGFSNFGEVIYSNENLNVDRASTHDYINSIALMKGYNSISINYLKAHKREMVIDKIEHHKKSQELIIPVDYPSILVVAPSGDMSAKDIINEMKAFYLDGSKAVILDKGVRHFIPYPVHDDAGFYIIFAEDTGFNDLYFDKLEVNVRLVLDL